MGIVSGGGGSGNTTAQVVASGKVVPVAVTGATIDTTTYNNPLGSGKLTTLVIAGDDVGFAIARSGDAFPRLLFLSDPTDGAIYMADGARDPYVAGNALS